MQVEGHNEIKYLSGRGAFSAATHLSTESTKLRRPTVSVITTVLNRASTIERAVLSVLEQSYPLIEYIVIDGGSKDRTCEILAKYSDRIDYIESSPDSGIYAGMNRGISRASGDFILLLNSDDWYIPSCVERLVKPVMDQGVDVVSALAYEVDECGRSPRKLPRVELGYNVLLRMPLRHETMLISRAVYDSVGLFDESYKIIGDLKHTQKIFRKIQDKTFAFQQLNDYVMYFRKQGAASNLTDGFIHERTRLLSENFPELSREELRLLAHEYGGNPVPYIDLAQKHQENRWLQKTVEAFLRNHGVFRDPTWSTLRMSVFGTQWSNANASSAAIG